MAKARSLQQAYAEIFQRRLEITAILKRFKHIPIHPRRVTTKVQLLCLDGFCLPSIQVTSYLNILQLVGIVKIIFCSCMRLMECER